MLVKIVDEDDFYYEEIFLELNPCSEYLVIEKGEIIDDYPFADQANQYWNNSEYSEIGTETEGQTWQQNSKVNKGNKKKGFGSRIKRFFGKKNKN